MHFFFFLQILYILCEIHDPQASQFREAHLKIFKSITHTTTKIEQKKQKNRTAIHIYPSQQYLLKK